ncbi:VOC family protein [Meiothermus ruber]|uniref:3-demethylubiquinone-9 3-methyltransferase n=1 Tax=Meiothermus ruber (strain ATCC 35948 / DSM 1279 / VKM B-1258 / 21) TaxID=504728 RepID=D3PLG2_MEIRD|nr:VOC family protein [Meiothermus ruber]ADD29053.1 3-demethylubiquinone-9 3-methyltransferase [Meiothermus ruber DSM 1279]AGK05496.1 3-demethylubiquinone-9 3-methyltransferase [Meiothermus ruber DSM 1279]MCL6528613.1 VOC family protein [Meiothermus ruber]
MFKIVPNLWFDKEAEEAARFYCDAIPGSRINSLVVLRDTPSGDCDLVSFELAGQPFMAISAGPFFKLNPSTSFILSFNPSQGRTQADLEALWNKLLPGGSVLMPLQAYPFAPLYGWIQDRYGLSWQLILSDPGGEARPFITPALLFVGEVCGKAEEAQDFYTSVFPNARRGATMRYPAGMAPEREGTLMYSEFMLAGQWFAAMDSAYPHNFAFNEAISFMIYCDTQAEIDHYWTKLSAVPEAEQCGWLKDRYGLSWQVVPRALEQMLQDPDPERVNRINQAVLQMKKLDLAELQKAYA